MISITPTSITPTSITPIPWPNSLGWDIGDHEIWKLSDNTWGVRTFKNGTPYKSLKVHPTLGDGKLFAPLTHLEAIEICLNSGDPIE